MDDLVKQALELLPASGTVVFDAYKAQLQTAMPDNAKDVFTHILKNNLLSKKVKYDNNKNIVVLLSRKV